MQLNQPNINYLLHNRLAEAFTIIHNEINFYLDHCDYIELEVLFASDNHNVMSRFMNLLELKTRY